MGGMKAIIAAAAAFVLAVPGQSQAPAPPPAPAPAPAWSVEPWLQDLAQARTAIETKYANLDYLIVEREFDLGGLFDRAAAALRGARSDADAKAVFDRIIQRIADGHVNLDWPRGAAPGPAATAPAAPAPPPTMESFCRARGFDPSRPGIAASLPGYAAVGQADVLPAGTIQIGGVRAGIVRIAKFEPGGSPALCPQAVAALAIPLDQACDDSCHDRIMTHAYRGLTLALEQRLAGLRAAGAGILILDLTGNGGGSEWVQAVARMVTTRRLVSQRMGFVRGPHWEGTWTRLGDKLREFARTASAADRSRLLAWAAEADAARAETRRTCPPTGGCPWLGRAGYATGLVGSARPGEYDGKEWGPWVFNAAQYPYREGAWDGPVIVLVDDYTASAAEELPALLQDNGAALIVGSRTAGLGCGHTWGGSPTRLANSGATLHLPDCSRFRADGSNEVRGILPDLLVPWRATDGTRFKARLLAAVLPRAVEEATALYRRSRAR
ncbi:MAG TPA: S41 family peptidase [Allosphingosinicella sp.]|jgi:hypothetical protein